MREIKFRGKRIDTGEWVHGYYLFNPFFNRAEIFSLDNERSYVYEVDPATVGQYTGLKDKNGVEIFEGDIVRKSNTTYIVEYWAGQLLVGWCLINILSGDTEYMACKLGFEVVGNVWEDGGLLNDC